MARIFLSHSSTNNAQARALGDWLAGNGWSREDVFLDIDEIGGIAAGERWQRALNEAAARCEAVIFLISRAWLSSQWCLEELALAHKLNKRLFGVIIDTVELDDIPARLRDEWQLIDLDGGRDGVRLDAVLPGGREAFATFSRSGLEKLRIGLVRAGLDPSFFAWPPAGDPDRAPYRGLAPMEAEDAGIFYGREAATITALDQIRGLSESAPPRLMVILGASGAGKSSFMRAGLIPRLGRDDNHFLVLPILRPQRAALTGGTGLVANLSEAATRSGLRLTRAQVAKAVAGGADEIAALLARLKAQALQERPGGEAKPPSVILPLDQAEELFLSEGRAEAATLLETLAALMSREDAGLIGLATIRTDSYERMQSAPALSGLRQATFSLPPLARGAYQQVIEGPVERLKGTGRALKIEPALTAALLADIEEGGAKDALPLLAFTLERLYRDHGADGDLTLDEYREGGGIAGALEAAVESAFAAADSDPAVPREPSARLALLRRAMIPWLAGIDPETRTPRRQVARFDDIPDEAKPLVEHFVAQRLLSTDVSPTTGERTVEPAHEALLRQWGLIDGWLREDISVLATLEGVRRAARDWDANARHEGWLTHGGGRLEDAEALRQRADLVRKLGEADLAYLAACRAAETQRRDRELAEARKLAQAQRRVAARTRFGLVAASLLGLAAGAFAWWGFDSARIAGHERQVAEAQRQIADDAAARLAQQLRHAQIAESRFLAIRSREAAAAGNMDVAIGLALEALPGDLADDPPGRPLEPSALSALNKAAEVDRFRAIAAPFGGPDSAAFSPDGKLFVTSSGDGSVQLWSVETGAAEGPRMAHERGVWSVAFSPDGKRILTAANDGAARLWDSSTGAPTGGEMRHGDRLTAAAFSGDGARIVTASGSSAFIWNGHDGAPTGIAVEHVPDLPGVAAQITLAAFSPDGTRLVTANQYGSAQLWDAATGAPTGERMRHKARPDSPPAAILSAAFSPDGTRLATGSHDASARLWDAGTGAPVGRPMQHDVPNSIVGGGGVGDIAFSPDGSMIATASHDGTLRLWDGATGESLDPRLPEGRPGENRERRMRHAAPVSSVRFSPDGARLVSASEDFSARVWDVSTHAMLDHPMWHGAHVHAADFSPDGTMILTAAGDGTARVWPVRQRMTLHDADGASAISHDGKRLLVFKHDVAFILDIATGEPVGQRMWHEDHIMTAVFSADGRLVLTASHDRSARLWDAASGKPVGQIMRHDGIVNSAEFSPDGALVLTISGDDEARLWDAATATPAIPPLLHDGKVKQAHFSPDGRRIVTVNIEHGAVLWDTADRSMVETLRLHRDPVTDAAFSADGSMLLTTSMDGTARIWDAGTGAPIGQPMAHGTLAYSGIFSPDGSKVLTAAGDSFIRVWSLSDTPRMETSFLLPTPLIKVMFSPDGKTILTVGADGTVHLWETSTGAELVEPLPHASALKSVYFSPDGAEIITTEEAGRTRFWKTPPRNSGENLLLAAAGRLRLPTEDERLQHYLTAPHTDSLAEPSPQTTQCDRLASHPYDPQALAAGVYWNQLDANAAVEACEAALAAAPEEARFRYLLARSWLRRQNDEAAAAGFRAAADAGYPMALYHLAIAHEEGSGVEQDLEKAARLYAEALGRGIYVAGHTLGHMQRDGRAGPASEARAIETWRSAASRGDPYSHLELAGIAETGRGGSNADLPQSFYHYAVAVKLLEQAGDLGAARAPRYRRASLARTLDPAIVTGKWREATAFKPARPQ